MSGTVTDHIEVKGRTALEYGAGGLVAIFAHDPGAALPRPGDPVLIVRSDGWLYRGKAEDVRHEPLGKASGLFLRDLTREDVPLGSSIRWGAEIQTLQSAVA